jgi:hypothetical protein
MHNGAPDYPLDWDGTYPLPPQIGNGPETSETKPTNPKDLVATNKAPLDLVPDSAVVGLAMAFLEGALKYGKFNWRIAGVQASVYVGACRRHLARWNNGEECDPKTRVHHLDSAMACLAILRDAMVCGKLIDNRPPKAPIAEMIEELAGISEHLREMNSDKSPHQFTIKDTPCSPSCPS